MGTGHDQNSCKIFNNGHKNKQARGYLLPVSLQVCCFESQLFRYRCIYKVSPLWATIFLSLSISFDFALRSHHQNNPENASAWVITSGIPTR